MVEIDDVVGMKKVDASGLLPLTVRFPEQVEEAMGIAKRALENFSYQPEKIVICGMGGSAIGGDITAAWAFNKARVPIVVLRDYFLPAFCDENTLVIAASYSGNTEETLSAFDDAIYRKCKIVSISSGGLLEKRAKENGVLHIKIPSGMPPRGATAYMLVPQLMILEAGGIAACEAELKETVEVCRVLRENLKPETPSGRNQAKIIARKILGTIPNILGMGISAPIAKRWRTQINENSKMIAREDVFPELNHNDTVGWSGDPQPERFSVIILRHHGEFGRNRMRIEITKDLVLKRAREIIEVWASGKTDLTKMLSLMYIGDFVSIYIAMLRDIDPTPVPVIENLKKLLAEKREE
ncbi:MAG: bifunctional phosphoglucose/phosphomannose isomerase [Thermoplasmata archaeon]|nr:bifunctional phosphoglucose/phosphomannose isomerase [Thermoplasmata archaeon]